VIILLIVVSGLQSMAAAPPDKDKVCPSGKFVLVPHIVRGGPPEAHEQLKQWLAGMKDPQIVGRIAQAFEGRICVEDAELIDRLGRMAQLAPVELRVQAVRVLSMLGGSEAGRIVRASLRDGAPAVRRQALVGVDDSCDRSALREVERLITLEDSSEVLSYAREVVKRLKGDSPCVGIPGLRFEDD
jgi:hypothetical protein